MQQGQPQQTEGMKRLSVSFAPSAYEALTELANSRGISLADALRDSIAVSKWFYDAQNQGGKIVVEHDNGIREIVRLLG